MNESTRTELRQDIREESAGSTFEAAPSPNQNLTFTFTERALTLSGLDFQDVQKRRMGIVGEDGRLTNLGLLLSDQCQYSIRVAVFAGKDRVNLIDRKELRGSLLGQLSKAYEFIEQFNEIQSDGTKNFPDAAVREALLNAILHRDYSLSGSALVSIFSDRMEIVTLGGLASGISMAAIELGATLSRNERLVNVFYRLKLAGGHGTGIQKIRDSYAEAGQDSMLEPEFKAVEGAFSVILPNLNFQAAQGQEQKSFTPKEQRLLRYMKTVDFVTRKQVETLLGLGQTAAGNVLRSLEEKGEIEKQGIGKSTEYYLK